MNKLTREVLKSNKKLTRKRYYELKKEQNKYKSILNRLFNFTDHRAKNLIIEG